jgi:hypothetical protein
MGRMEPIEGSETSAIRTKTPGNYPKENILHIEHGESLKSSIFIMFRNERFIIMCNDIKVFVGAISDRTRNI